MGVSNYQFDHVRMQPMYRIASYNREQIMLFWLFGLLKLFIILVAAIPFSLFELIIHAKNIPEKRWIKLI
ncbi:hypothetical protein [Candidatus Moranella endobia]|uniref:hypothetical protein n=1 Tax=Candidatus Moranella endobia TaxID=1048758 RepID=UPI00059E0AEA|nr:hypothetical protein [Candidatus Moranella endobia]